jgi:RHS repeat-associated protein
MTSYYHADGLGSITSLSGSAGSLTETYGYDSFGKQTSSSGSLTNPLRYTAREFDSETSLYYYRARYYDPSVGRFLTEDPIRIAGGGPDFYGYVQNDPADNIDPSGLCPPPNCFADLKFRPLDPPILGATHSFWYVQDKNGQRWTVSGYPTGANGTGFLNITPTPGSQSTQLGKDNPSAPTHWSTGLSAEICAGVDKLLAAANGFPKRQIPYNPGGPNSNSAANYLGGVAGFTPTVPPPGSLGWEMPILPYNPNVPYRPPPG